MLLDEGLSRPEGMAEFALGSDTVLECFAVLLHLGQFIFELCVACICLGETIGHLSVALLRIFQLRFEISQLLLESVADGRERR